MKFHFRTKLINFMKLQHQNGDFLEWAFPGKVRTPHGVTTLNNEPEGAATYPVQNL